ncbi:hypothetical protein FCL47_07770 [Desulfopila sp. IMCC35006]|uniref:hypothetical protein n=1 Tax=Desulfopila sp. IMCC35006 TaxID=2569542 RepID=UPI0010AD2F9E|nr:hypothetical protein [Desulfopila sp. IMCC35006]TKB27068.1 hypothetical protein FCL47_07770 [Desulfopila sp. IMCC35006]
MKLHCPHCGVKGSADDSYLGRKVKCPKCQGIFDVVHEMAAELSTEAAHVAAAASAPANSPTTAKEDAAPILQQETEAHTVTAEALSGNATEQMLDLDDGPAGTGPSIQPPAQEIATEEESLNWDDVAAEIDLQLAEVEGGAEQADVPEGSPVDMGALEDDFTQPAAGATVAPEIAAVDGDQDGEIVWDDVQLVEETDESEPEPAVVDKKQCRQCGKSENHGESFLTRDGLLYCADCAPVEDAAKAADTGGEQDAEGAAVAARAADAAKDQSSLGTAIKKAWLQVKGIFSRN